MRCNDLTVGLFIVLSVCLQLSLHFIIKACVHRTEWLYIKVYDILRYKRNMFQRFSSFLCKLLQVPCRIGAYITSIVGWECRSHPFCTDHWSTLLKPIQCWLCKLFLLFNVCLKLVLHSVTTAQHITMHCNVIQLYCSHLYSATQALGMYYVMLCAHNT